MGKSEQKMVKVWIDLGEDGGPARKWLWATAISERVVKIENIPFFTTLFMLGDLVAMTEEKEITRIIECCGRTRQGRYVGDGSPEEVNDRWQMLKAFLHTDDIPIKGMGYGLFSMAGPRDVNDDALAEMAVASPVPFNLLAVE